MGEDFFTWTGPKVNIFNFSALIILGITYYHQNHGCQSSKINACSYYSTRELCNGVEQAVVYRLYWIKG